MRGVFDPTKHLHTCPVAYTEYAMGEQRTHVHVGIADHSHAHDDFNAAEHGHSHEILDGPGSYMQREMPLIEGRDWNDRAFTVGIGGYASFLLSSICTV